MKKRYTEETDSYHAVSQSDHTQGAGIRNSSGEPQDKTHKEVVEGCQLCERQGLKLTRHHLIPLSQHNKQRTKRAFSKVEMKEQIAMLCRPCHSQIHRIFDNHELATYYHTIEHLKQHSDIIRFVNWVQKRPVTLRIKVRY